MGKVSNGIRYGLNVLEDTTRNFMEIPKIRCIRYTTTWECNSKCDSCYIWKEKVDKKKILTYNELSEFAKSKYLKGVRRIIISGGEPFLVDDLPRRLAEMHRLMPKAYFGMTANGLTPKRTERMLKEIFKIAPKINIRNLGLSLNGPREVHDKSRGIPGAFEKTMDTYRRIKGLVPVRFSFLFLPYNIQYYEWVQKFAKKKGTTAYLCWTVISNRFMNRNFLGEMGLNEFYNKIMPILDKNVKHMTKRYLWESFVRGRHLDCTACKDFFHLDPYGNIYPCNFKLTDDRILGNIKKSKFDDIWESAYRTTLVKDIEKGKCLYPEGGGVGVCGDSDINYSITNSGMHKVLMWYLNSSGKMKWK